MTQPAVRLVTVADLPHVKWRKSRRSNNGGSCVEAATHGRTHLARDSKTPNGPVLTFTPAEWARFLEAVKTGTYDLT